jgi:hypothetical protein
MYVDEAGGNRIGTTIGNALAGFAATANEGGFAVNEHGGEALLRVVREMTDWVDGRLGGLGELGQEPPLGVSVGAGAVTPHLARVATDDQGLLTQLGRLRETLAQVELGIRKAMSNYRSVDNLNAAGLR